MRRDAGSPARTARALLVLVGLLGAGACGFLERDVQDPFGGDRGMKWIRIAVQNHNFSDATLHALRGVERHRLGIVVGKTDAEYLLDWPSTMPLRIEIDLLADDSCVTRALQVDPGDHIELQIPTDLSLDPDCRPTG